MCSHPGEAEIWTTAAYIVDLSSATLWVCIGAPDQQHFEPYSLGDSDERWGLGSSPRL